MTETAATPRVVKNLLVTIGATSYSKHVNNCTITPTTPVQNWKGGTPDSLVPDVGAPTYVCALTLVHDYQNADSLYNFLLANAGTTATLVYQPDADGDFSVSVDVVLISPTVGGDVDKFNQSTIQMPCGAPAFTYPS
ncbi:MAG TPA: hypothetical protein VGM94_02750 [Galbitalea sp.]|jgi:hypothetical protein